MSENMPNSAEKREIPQKIAVREVSVKNVVEKLLEPLSAKQKLVITSRFGIGNGAGQTLESIGKNFDITRERVRQIEADAINILKKSKQSEPFAALADLVKEIMKEKGGIASGEDLAREVFSRHFANSRPEEREARMIEIVFSVAGLKRTKANRETVESWTSPDFDRKYFNEVVSEIENIFDKSKKILNREEILKKMHYSEFVPKRSEMKPEHVVNFLKISKKFGKNVFGDWGKSRWPLVRPRGVREKATLVLMKQRKPLHFREIGKLIEKYGLSRKKVHAQTVHNELIRDKRFVLVGRGTYALREWGYEEGTVRDVIASLLKSAGGFLSRENIYNAVLKKRKVKKATIAVNLANKKFFEKAEGGYKLK